MATQTSAFNALTGVSVGSNANVVIDANSNANFANVSANYFTGNGSQLSNVLTVSQYTAANGNVNYSNVVANVHGLTFDTTTGFTVTDLGGGNALIQLGSSFKTWQVAGQTSLVAVGEDTVEFVDGNNIVITTNANANPQQIEFSLDNNVTLSGNLTAGNAHVIGVATVDGDTDFNPPTSVEYLVVAGGGAGGYAYGGGGGAGGYRTAAGLAISATTYTVTVGAGGAAATTYTPNNGSDSTFFTITSTGGGSGAPNFTTGNSGGSGGGAQYTGSYAPGSGNTPSTSPSQGNNGGIGDTTNSNFGGGGGGAGAAGYAGNHGTFPGQGGAGLSSSISGTSTYYAGGGGGWTRNTGTTLGGQGGGGGGVTSGTAVSGTVNTGGGGGSSADGSTTGAGGSGIVIIRYPDTYSAAASYTGATYTVSGGYRIYRFTTSGSITFGGTVNSTSTTTGALVVGGGVGIAKDVFIGGNITSSNLVNFSSASNVSLGNVSNVHITGGSNGYVLTTNGSGVLSWSAAGGGAIGATGATGSAGANGATGATGTIGSTGATGATGVQGTTGATGIAGDRYATTSNTSFTLDNTGNQTIFVNDLYVAYSVGQPIVVSYNANNIQYGTTISYNPGTGALIFKKETFTGSGTYAAWIVNLSGAIGSTGLTGTTGATGATGTAGTNGATGATGVTGNDGATGATGTAGTNGATGATGVTGNDGATGATGTSGTNGATGATGTIGSTGATGPVAGSNTQVIFNDSNAAGASANLTFNNTTNALTLTNGNLYTPTNNTGLVGGANVQGQGYVGSFNGSSQYLATPNNTAFGFGTGDYTMECWIYPTGGGTRLFEFSGNSDNVDYNTSTGTISYYNGSSNVYSAGGLINANTWAHIAIVRLSGTVRVYVNGVLAVTQASTPNSSTRTLYIGGGTNSLFTGYISNTRVVKGLGVYTGNFTAPTGPLTATASANPFGGSNTAAITGVQTSLLTLQNSTIIDNSSYVFSITNNGSVTTGLQTVPFGSGIYAGTFLYDGVTWQSTAIQTTSLNVAVANLHVSGGSSGYVLSTDGSNTLSWISPSSGATGATGIGATGATGATGTAGSNGATGATGTAGSNGATGATGTAGSNGATGATGVTGNDGATGATGASGVNGATGATGTAGTNGATGATGVTGNDGSTGATGTAGSNGATGATGVTGNDGATGATGASGVNGATGATGTAGTNGATGATGTAGTNGSTGATGTIGSTGATGPVAGSNTQVIFNDAGAAGASANLTFDKTTNILTVAGNIIASNFVGTLANGNSNVYIGTSNGNVTVAVVGNTTLTVTGTGINVAGYANFSGNANIGGNINVSGNIITASGTGGNLTGGNVISANTIIISANANFSTASNVFLGSVSNLHITGGSAGYVLSTDGANTLSWISPSSGATGATGIGATGATGYIGSTGATGATGTIGSTGATGATGVTGNDGATGATGITGNDGATGATGVTGNDGATGATGTAGTNGATGATGVTGNDGATGATGVTGNNGATGATGITGNDGATGATGITGNDGATGATGASGVNGATGATGTSGTNGATGATGTSGTNGATGATGTIGSTGATGPVAGSNTQVIFNNANAAGASANLTFNNTTNALTLTNGNLVTPTNNTGLVGGQTILGQGYVGSFNGSQYLNTATNSAFDMGTGSFTVEVWFYWTSNTGQGGYDGEQGIVGSGPTGTSAFTIRLAGGPTTKVISWWLNGPGNENRGSTAINKNQWYHVALVRSGSGSNNCKVYLNGVLESQATITDTLTSYPVVIGRVYTDYNSEYLTGYISNTRIVKGLAVYTGNFTVPTAPLSATQAANPYGGANTSAITGTATSLLTLQNSTIIDNSSYAFSITNNNSVTVVLQAVPFSSSIYVGTILYDGSTWQTTAIQTTSLNVAVANLHVSGGSSGYVLSTDGSNTLSWIAPSSGATGATGIGATGATGVTGATGTAGSNGSTGATGVTGNDGATGATGVTGNDGATGATGASGVNGATGATGTAGTNGATGATGITGNDGATGATGITGNDGATGATGITGNDGSTGATGTIGSTGATGPVAGSNTQVIFNDSNAAGASANLTFDKTTNLLTVTGNISTGNANVSGAITLGGGTGGNLTGANVISANSINISSNANFSSASNVFLGNVSNLHITGGSSGYVLSTDGANTLSWISPSSGATGATGIGATGATGATGTAGSNGATGATGTSGTNGATGATGTAGSNGATGATGASGVNGSTGATGTSGTNGSTGATGTIGSTGATGPVAGSNTQVIFNNANAAGASANLTFNNTTNALTLTNGNLVTPTNNTGLVGGANIAGQAYVGSFNGTNQYLSTTIVNSLLLPTSSTPFTLEGWFYTTAAVNGTGVISYEWTIDGGEQQIPFSLGFSGLYPCVLSVINTYTQTGLTSPTPVTVNTWYHIAAVFNGTATTLYVNGTSVASGTVNISNMVVGAAYTGTSLYIGKRWDNYTSPYYSGYISNIRFVIGTAVYTGNFTVPTGPLTATAAANPFGGVNTSAITGTQTKLLTLQNSTIIDNSSYGRSFTNYGTVTTGLQTVPFGSGLTIGTFLYDGTTWQSTPIQTTGLNVAVANLHVSGGSSGYVLSTDGANTLSWIAPSSGATGATGIGATGATGYIGTTGATGATGVIGNDGATGATGITGNDGATGATGITGNDGATGATGITGNDGATGATGITGNDGATGATGTIGSTGATGPVAGSNTQVIFNDSNAAGASANLTFDKTTNLLTVIGNISTGNANVSGAITLGGGTGGNLTGANVISANTINISVNANFSSASNVTLGNVGNLHISGGSSGYVLSTDGANTLSWIAPSSGATGATGIGATGATGTAGTNGSTGATGVIGNDGATGATGVIGNDGATGASGVNGATGATGVTGNDGATGATGTAGVDGATGATGTAGSNGATGATGVTGNDGATGATGVTGNDGATGATGTAGSNGATGATGATGTAGANGATGATGVTGNDGATGATGTSGTNGSTGATGTIGSTGATGPVAGSNTQVIFNNANAAGASANLTFNNTTNALTLTNGNLVTPTNNTGLVGGVTLAGQGYVGNFNGTSQYLDTQSSSQFNLTGDFTIECWIYKNDPAADGCGIFDIGTQDPDSSLVRISGGVLQFWLGGSTGGGPGTGTKTGAISCATSILNYTWYHVALVRSGSSANNVKLYLNGVLDGQGTGTYQIPTGYFAIGHDYPTYPVEFFPGYISNLRVVKGVAVYTGTFTVPTGTLTATASANPFGGANTSAITGTATSLLTLQNSTIIDNSSYVLSITNTGTVTTGFQTVPFGSGVYAGTFLYDGTTWQSTALQVTTLTVSGNASVTGNITGGNLLTDGNIYTPTTNTGLVGGISGAPYVGYFNGTSYPSISSTSAFNLVGDFTLEAFVYPTYRSSGDWGILDARVNGASPSSWIFSIANGKIQFYTGSSNLGTGTIPLNTWTHIAVVRSGSALNYYINGVLDTARPSFGTGAISPGTTSALIGSKDNGLGASYSTVGSITNLRIVNGTAVYTGNFTTPTGTLTATQSANPFGGANTSAITGTVTKLLTLQDSTLIDNSSFGLTITANGVTMSQSAPPPFASAAQGTILYDGSTWQTTPIQTTGLNVAVGNLHVSGGSSGYVLSTDGANTLSWIAPTSGATGATGIGATGATGVQGTTGATGASGVNGSTGATGTAGANGATGATGVIGNDGATGATGASGVNGSTGATGTSGTNGSTGATGTIGSTGATGPVAGSNTQVIFNDSNTAGASANLTFDKTTNLLTVTGNINTGNANISGAITLGGGTGGNLTGANVISANSINISSNANFSSASNVFLGNVSNLHITGGSSGYVLSTDGANTLSWIAPSSGATGLTGSTGATGATGTIGSTGATGATGVIGNDGATGATGVTGNDGATGATGTSGTNGSTGATGTIGSTGATGPVAGSNTQVIFNDANAAGASANLTFNNTTNALTLTNGNLVTPTNNTGLVGGQTIAGQGYVAFFNGTGQYLNIASNAALAFGTGDFTVETWVNPTNTSQVQIINLSNSFQFWVGAGVLNIYDSGTTNTGGTITLNTWQHVAVTRIGTSLKGYINGVQVISVTSSTSFSQGSPNIIGGSGGGPIGYYSNLRVVKGLGVYTGNFTVPTGPLTATASANPFGGANTSAITGTATSLLTLQNSTIIDNSTYGLVLTNTGPVTTSQQTVPFGSGIYAGTFLYDGTTWQATPIETTGLTVAVGDLYVSGGSSGYVLSTDGANTLSWIAPSSGATGATGIGATGATGYIGTTGATGATGEIGSTGATGATGTSGATGATGVTGNDGATGATGASGVNGATGATGTSGTNGATGATGTAGTNGATGATGTAGTNGATGATGTIGSTGATGPVAGSNTQVIFNNANAAGASANLTFNNTTNALTLTNGNLVTPTNNTGLVGGVTLAGQGYVGSFNGSSQYLSVASNAAFSFSTGDFTLEAWIYLNTAATGTDYRIFTNWGGGGDSYQFYLRAANNRLIWQLYSQNSPDVAGLQITPFTWTHVAFCRSGTTIKTFINGALADTTTGVTNSANGTGTPTIGADPGGGNYFFGYISNLRIVKGLAVYTGTFTAPTGPLTATASANPFGGANTSAITGVQTSLLTLQNSTIIDNSSYVFSITNTGTVTTGLQTVPFGSGIYAGTFLYDGTTWQATPIQTTGLTVAVANLSVTGGSANQVLSTNGSGTMSFKTGSITVVGRAGNISIPVILS